MPHATPTTIDLPPLLTIERAIGEPYADWSHRCHEISLAIVKSGVLGVECRVARGACRGVGSQHSWIVLGMDCYADPITIVDPTLWSYVDGVNGVWLGDASVHDHTPHGSIGSIWTYGRPMDPTGDVIELAVPVNPEAEGFLKLIGPMDDAGWQVLLHAPVHGWPAAEIIRAAYLTDELRRYIPTHHGHDRGEQ